MLDLNFEERSKIAKEILSKQLPLPLKMPSNK